MKWTSREIDTRNQLHGIMRYQIKCDLPRFFDARNWCWAQFGPGIEYEHFINFTVVKQVSASLSTPEIQTEMIVPKWCWDATKWNGSALRHGKIYLATEEYMTLFSLRWS